MQQKRLVFLQAFLNGRDDTIRTCDPFVPSEVRYQAALHPVITFALRNICYSVFNPAGERSASSHKTLNGSGFLRQSQAALHPDFSLL